MARKRDSGLRSNVLFSLGSTRNEKRTAVENVLKQSCGPNSLAQKTACWFLGKMHIISGTAAGKVYSRQASFDNDDDDDD